MCVRLKYLAVKEKKVVGGRWSIGITVVIVVNPRWSFFPGATLNTAGRSSCFTATGPILPALASRVIDVPRSAWEDDPDGPPGGQ